MKTYLFFLTIWLITFLIWDFAAVATTDRWYLFVISSINSLAIILIWRTQPLDTHIEITPVKIPRKRKKK